jgi:hypothetical protein
MSIAIITRFKNERHIMYEWVHHHFAEGVNKIYMIDDYSDDDFMKENPWLIKYINLGKIEIFKSMGTQYEDYDKHLTKIKKNHKWIIQIDIDEFLYCPYPKYNIRKMLKLFDRYDYIIIKWKLFSHRCKEQPKSVINNNVFTHKTKIDYTSSLKGAIKCIGKTRFLKSISIHNMLFNRKKIKTLKLFNAHNPYLQLNHYRTQSDEYVLGVKEQRGGGVNKDKYKKIDNKHKKFSKKCLILKKRRKDLIKTLLERKQVKPNIYKNSSWYKSLQKNNEKENMEEIKEEKN